ncbi:hypothetical protein NM688_g5814 [Phlebia brevispora]|uniref:Uncharacterized protein n=1 Tax=Phlebia brevispora TaxID=194682 RepID=A0ACC1SPM3_9APHY|nr:hypothetical protein NM688_g5814 [Phlebia brevispora]
MTGTALRSPGLCRNRSGPRALFRELDYGSRVRCHVPAFVCDRAWKMSIPALYIYSFFIRRRVRNPEDALERPTSGSSSRLQVAVTRLGSDNPDNAWSDINHKSSRIAFSIEASFLCIPRATFQRQVVQSIFRAPSSSNFKTSSKIGRDSSFTYSRLAQPRWWPSRMKVKGQTRESKIESPIARAHLELVRRFSELGLRILEGEERRASVVSDAEKADGPAAAISQTDYPDHVDAEKDWKTEDQQILPKNNLPLVFFSLLLATFLAALDQTIVATALPTIVEQLQGGQDYSWVGSAYLLASCALSPFYGKISDIVGRKTVLYPVIVIFLIGSALCGAAQSMTWLVVCRAIQGIGGGGIFQMVNIIIGDIVPLEKRGTFGGYAGALWGIASIIGPLVGGAFTDHVTWRWCFWVNLPTGGVALVLLFFTLHLNPVKHGKTIRQHVSEFDFLGLLLIVGGVVCVLLGFNQSENAWNSPATIALLVVGGVLIVLAGGWEAYTTRSPIIPPRLFRVCCHPLCSLTGAFTFYLMLIDAYYEYNPDHRVPAWIRVLRGVFLPARVLSGPGRVGYEGRYPSTCI